MSENICNKNRVVITGMGVITSNGNNVDEFFQNCIDGNTGLKRSMLFDATNFSTEYDGEIASKEYPYLTKEPKEKERIQYLVEDCVKEMLEDGNLTKEYISSLKNEAYLCFATSLGTNSKILQFTKDKKAGNIKNDWLLRISSLLPEIKEVIGVEGGCYTTTTACAASTTSVGIGYELIKSGKAKLVIAGGADPMSEFSYYGFNSLRALSKSVCKPFDENRDGINIGEAAGFVILESLEHAQERKAKIYAEMLGYGINNDAYHITSPDPNGEGAYLSMKMASLESNNSLDTIDYINAHGTGTKLNDRMEMKAIQRLFQDTKKEVSVSSIKSMVGHCLAAAGIIELIITITSINKQLCVCNHNLENEMTGFDNVKLLKENGSLKIRTALTNNFAFAGNTASILVGAFDEKC